MAFTWDKIHKWETNIENEILSSCEDYICEHYGVELIDDLSKDQIEEIKLFQKDLWEESIMQYGFNTVLEIWNASKMDDGIFEDDDDYINS